MEQLPLGLRRSTHKLKKTAITEWREDDKEEEEEEASILSKRDGN